MRDFEKDLEYVFKEKMIGDPEFCKEIWSALANVDWTNKDGSEYGCTFRYAGGLIADIRGEGGYMDWYCSGPYSTVSPEISLGMEGLGWTWAKM